MVDWRFIQLIFRSICPSHVAQVAPVSFHTVDGPKFLQCTKPCKPWDKLPFPQLVSRISEPSTASCLPTETKVHQGWLLKLKGFATEASDQLIYLTADSWNFHEHSSSPKRKLEKEKVAEIIMWKSGKKTMEIQWKSNILCGVHG